MQSPQTGDAPTEASSTVESPVVESPAATRSVAERSLIALVGTVVAGLVLVAVGRGIGPDILRQVRRWSGARQVVAPPVFDLDSQFSRSVTDNGPTPQRPDRMTSLAADAQISPPRRRVPGQSRDSQAVHEAAPSDGQPAEPELKTDGPFGDPAVAPGDAVANATGMAADRGPANTGPAGKPDTEAANTTTRMLETAAQLVNLSWQDFDYPVQWNAADTSKPRMLYASHRNRLLKAIAHTSPSALSLEMARKDYAVARDQFAGDPRLDYAYGLALWKHGQTAEAIDMFQTAARLEGVPFLPAALAVAWGRFLNHDERRGLDQLAHISRVLAASTEAYPPDSQKEQAALSVGRALGYLTGPGQIPAVSETVDLTSKNILKRLPDSLLASYESGQTQVGQRQSELLQLVDLPLDGIQSGHRVHRDELQTRIDDLRGEMRDARNSLARSHVSHVDKIAEILKGSVDMTAQFEKLRSSLKKLTDARMKAATPKPHMEKKSGPAQYDLIIGQGGQSQIVRSNPTMTFQLPETASERAARVSQLSKIREDRKKIEQDLSKLREEQADLVARRHQAEKDQKLEKDDARRGRVARIQEQRELERKLLQLNQALRRTMFLREGVDTIAAYIPWNIEVEGEALWQALNAKPQRRTP